MATYVLVHGAWHGGWCWKRVACRLRAQGHEVFTPSLTGLAERSHLVSRTVDLETHVTDIVNLLAWEELADIVLCGHSYGGMVVTGVADRAFGRVRALAYLDALVPTDGQSLLDATLPERRAALTNRVDHAGGGWLVAPYSAATLGVNEADRERVDRLCVPHPLACFEQKLVLHGRSGPVARRLYIEATAYRPSPFTRLAEQFRRDPSWTVESIDCGHDAMIDAPDAVSDLLLGLA